MRKYGIDRAPTAIAAQHRVVDSALKELETALGSSPVGADGPRTLLGGFSFADIAACAGLNMVERHPRLRVGEVSRALYRLDDLAEKYASLLRWRDAVYERFRN